MANMKLPTLPDFVIEKLTKEEQLTLQQTMTVEVINNVLEHFKHTPIILLPGKGGFYETITQMVKDDFPSNV